MDLDGFCVTATADWSEASPVEHGVVGAEVGVRSRRRRLTKRKRAGGLGGPGGGGVEDRRRNTTGWRIWVDEGASPLPAA
ncbi:hypothetical protein E2562_030018 [Oryza meyeriana var. granulata]|uniref:DUF834 domain-containing protein n=1 Tax=Oryza meyeriana var. granulata TaxID=110450 RepID=A0A6G1E4E3_9ORYZ|nr:hypothetical protein E2562_030018 [Oryza meyeriana var. granulata]